MVDAKDIHVALVALVKQAIRQKYSKTSKVVKEHCEYARKLTGANHPDKFAKYVAKKIFPDEEKYNNKISYYRKYYKGDLLTKIEELYALYYELAQEDTKAIEKAVTEDELDELADDLCGKFAIEGE